MRCKFQIMHTIPPWFVIFWIDWGVLLHILCNTIATNLPLCLHNHFHSNNPLHSWFGQWYRHPCHAFKLQYHITMREHQTSYPHNKSIPSRVCKVVHLPPMLDEPTRQESTFKWHLMSMENLKSASLVSLLLQGIAKSTLQRSTTKLIPLQIHLVCAHPNNITLFLLGR